MINILLQRANKLTNELEKKQQELKNTTDFTSNIEINHKIIEILARLDEINSLLDLQKWA